MSALRTAALTPVARPWGQGKLLTVLSLVLITVICLLAGLANIVYSAIVPTPPVSRVTTVSQVDSSTADMSETQRRDALAAADMLAVSAEDAWRGTPAATPGPVIEIPASRLIGPAKIPTGFPHTPEGAVGQLAEIKVGVLTEMSIGRANEMHAAWSMPEAPGVEQWPLMGHVQSFLASARMGSVKDPGTTVVITPMAAQVKAKDGPDWVVACVLSDVRAIIDVQARMAFGYCERMQWDGDRWLIAAGDPPALAPSTWPDTELAFRAGWRVWAKPGR